jgi:titin
MLIKSVLLIGIFVTSLFAINAPYLIDAVTLDSNTIQLTWRDNSLDEQGFIIERRSPGEMSFAPVFTVDSNITVFNDATLSHSQTYSYEIRAFNALATSIPSSIDSAKTDTFIPPLITIANFGADIAYDTINSKVIITIQDRNMYETGYRIYWGENDTNAVIRYSII